MYALNVSFIDFSCDFGTVLSVIIATFGVYDELKVNFLGSFFKYPFIKNPISHIVSAIPMYFPYFLKKLVIHN